MTDSSIHAGVIGVGSMGQNHARVYQSLSDVNLVGIFDADSGRAEEVASMYGADAMSRDQLLSTADVVSIAVPTSQHHETAVACLQSDLHVLIEKPIAPTVAEAEELINLSKARDLTLQVGHIERFNPAVSALAQIVNKDDIVAVRAERLGPPPTRAIHDNAIIDLMIHDADILLSLLEEEPSVVHCVGTHANKYASATLEFKSGVVGTLIASRLTESKVRKLKITTEERFIELDYIDQSVEIHRSSAPEYLTQHSGIQYRHESVVEQLQVENREPLKAEIESFVEAARTGTEPRVTGRDGIKAFYLVSEIDSQT